MAHAKIVSIDSSHAKLDGVVAILDGRELARHLPDEPDGPFIFPAKWKAQVRHSFLNPRRPLLASDKVRYVGEALAVVVADSKNLADDAVECISYELDPLEVVIDPEAALDSDAVLVHEKYATNLFGQFELRKGDIASALATAPHKLRRRIYHHRQAATPLECRGAVASYDTRTDTVTLWATTQSAHLLRREVANVLKISENRVRVIAPDVGGSFGGKSMSTEYVLVAFLACLLKKPVCWIEGRQEYFLSASHARDQVHNIEVSFDRSGKLLSLQDDITIDCGAWYYSPATVAYNTAAHLLGPYKVDNVFIRCRVAATNKAPTAPYRGAGRPEAALAIERALDLVAETLKLDPVDIRFKNMVQAEEIPYQVGLPYRDGEPIVYDSGNFPDGLEKALAAIGGLQAFRERQKEALAQGRYIGLGVACFTEGTGVGPFEGVVLKIDSSGKLYLGAGVCSQGQGMETIFAQIVADTWFVDVADVVVALGDSSLIPNAFGTMGSRGTVTVSAGIYFASERLRKKVLAIGAHLLECSVADLELRHGGVGIVGAPGTEITLAKIAAASRAGWDHGRPAGIEPGLEEIYYYEPSTVTWAYAAIVAIVEADLQTGQIKLKKIVVAHDCGQPINPMLVDGQVMGGVVQGIGGVLIEQIFYDENGQLLTGSFMDYGCPIAGDVPSIEIIHLLSKSPLNPLGVKGVGEGGAIAPPAAIANAVSNALRPFNIEINETPIKPEFIVGAVRAAIERDEGLRWRLVLGRTVELSQPVV
jgi:carbon-monoxide dehydrogenase large subunit